MADHSAIEWTDATWNPVRGCTRVSEGCRNCYAEAVAARFSGEGRPYHGFAERDRAGSKWTGRVELIEAMLTLPLRWKKPRRIFVNSMSDLFHEALPDAAIDRVFAVMALCPQHTFQVLTKRPARIRRYLTKGSDRANDARFDWAHALPVGEVFHRTQHEIEAWLDPCATHAQRDLYHAKLVDYPLPNVWLGVSVEDQAAADERIPDLLATPAAVRFISAEPLLSAVDVAWALSRAWPEIAAGFLARGHFSPSGEQLRPLDWVIAGGESGPNARYMLADWARSLRDQCQAAGVPFFFKQWGEWLPAGYDGNRSTAPRRIGKKAAGATLDGREWREFPR